MYVAISFKECILFDTFAQACAFVRNQSDKNKWKIRKVRKG